MSETIAFTTTEDDCNANTTCHPSGDNTCYPSGEAFTSLMWIAAGQLQHFSRFRIGSRCAAIRQVEEFVYTSKETLTHQAANTSRSVHRQILYIDILHVCGYVAK
jgi:hypothetical protein